MKTCYQAKDENRDFDVTAMLIVESNGITLDVEAIIRIVDKRYAEVFDAETGAWIDAYEIPTYTIRDNDCFGSLKSARNWLLYSVRCNYVDEEMREFVNEIIDALAYNL